MQKAESVVEALGVRMGRTASRSPKAPKSLHYCTVYLHRLERGLLYSTVGRLLGMGWNAYQSTVRIIEKLKNRLSNIPHIKGAI